MEKWFCGHVESVLVHLFNLPSQPNRKESKLVFPVSECGRKGGFASTTYHPLGLSFATRAASAFVSVLFDDHLNLHV
eukprot:934775-Amphidinium_carterae.1